jgi:hypothetical protein
MSRELTTEEKKKFLIDVAEGRKSPDELGEQPIYICLRNEKTNLIEISAYGKTDLALTDEQYEVWRQAIGRKSSRTIIIMEYLAPGCESLDSEPEIQPKPEPVIQELKQIEETVTQETEAEIVEEVPEDTIRIGAIRVTYDESRAVRTVHDSLNRLFNR